MTDTEDKNSDGLQSVILTMNIIEQVVRTPKGVGVTSLANTLGTSKSRIHRHLQTLVQQGYVFQQDDSERYELGSKLLSLGQSVFDNMGLIRASNDPLLDLRDALGHSAVASQLTPEGMLVIATVPGRASIEIGVRVGSILSFHGSAQGKVATAFSSQAFQARVLRNRLELFTPETIVSPTVPAAGLGSCAQSGRSRFEHARQPDIQRSRHGLWRCGHRRHDPVPRRSSVRRTY